MTDNKEDDDDTFIVLWMVFHQAMLSVFITRYQEIKEKIRTAEPAHFSGQNILQFALRIKNWVQELTDADQFEHHLTLAITKNLLKGGGDANELWRMHFLVKVPPLNKALLEIAHMSNPQKHAYMKKEQLLPSDILKTARTEYQSQIDNNEWIPKRKNQRHAAHQGMVIPPNVPNPKAQALVPGNGSNPGCDTQSHICDCILQLR